MRNFSPSTAVSFSSAFFTVLFLFATLLMLYYKQVVEGYEDASRFAIMQRVGMTKRDIRESVNAQMLLIFLRRLPRRRCTSPSPSPMVWQIMQLFGIQNLTLFLGVTRRGAASFRAALLRDVPPDVECVFPHRQHCRRRGVTRFTI